jgi:diacylglycerol kinase (ATP)
MQSFNNNKTLFILNPNAGIEGIALLVRRLKKYRNEVDFCSFKNIEEFRSFINSHRDDYDTFIAVGGDGTVNSLASALIDSGKVLGVLPMGSGNGFAREMGFKKNVKRLIEDIRKKDSFEIDVLYINDTPSINVSGVGIDSLVAHEFSDFKLRGLWSYGVSAFRVVGRIKPFKASVTIGSTKIEDSYFMVSVANTRQFGSNAIVAPMAVPDDGKYNLVLLKHCPKVLFPWFVLKMMKGSVIESKYLKYIESDIPVTIRTEEFRIHIDGEPVIMKNDINITIRKNALRVLRSSKNTRISKN